MSQLIAGGWLGAMKADADPPEQSRARRLKRFNRVSVGGLVAFWVGASILIGVVNHDATASLIVGGLLSVGATLGGLATAGAGASSSGRPSASERRIVWGLLAGGALLLGIGGLFAIVGLPALLPLVLAFVAVLCSALITVWAVLA